MPAKNVVVKGISIDPELLELGLERAKQLGFRNSFSAYVQLLIENDAKGKTMIQESTIGAVAAAGKLLLEIDQSHNAAHIGDGGADKQVDLSKHSSTSYLKKPKRRRSSG